MRTYPRKPAGCGVATTLPDFDFETFSEAGYVWDAAHSKFRKPPGAAKKGLFAVGAAVYAEHASTEVLSLCYDLKDGMGPEMWVAGAGMPNPQRLFDHIAAGGLLEAHNSGFEYHLWHKVCRRLYGWPDLPQAQLRCSMAKARASAYPGALANLAKVLKVPTPKEKDGKRLIKKFCCPHDPTATKARTRIYLGDDPADAQNLYAYNAGDIKTEAECSELVPDLPPDELAYWLADQAINLRGIGVDVDSVHNCIAVLEQAHSKYNAELAALTRGAVAKASEVSALAAWVYDNGGPAMSEMDIPAVEEALRGDLPPRVKRALQIRQLIGAASVKKVYAMARMATADDRLCDLHSYHGARTGRDAHQDVQPGNLPKAGPLLRWCGDVDCGHPFVAASPACPHCGASAAFAGEDTPWSAEAVPFALAIFAHRSLELVEYYFGDAMLTLTGCVRGLLKARPGYEFLSSDYSSIEAVVTACLSGEQWRIDAFRRKEDVYLHGAASVSGRSFEWYMANGGKKHPDRQKLGKPAELGLGFGGWLGAWRQFDKTDNFTDDEVKAAIVKWWDASPMIVEMWGGQVRGKPWRPERYELFGLEGMAISAVMEPGAPFAYRDITYQMKGDALYCRLPSGRLLTYHSPRLAASTRWEGQQSLSYMGWNSNPKMGALGWIRIETYGGRLFENVVQATARDVMAKAVIDLEATGRYPVVLRVHDEILTEVLAGTGSVEELEQIMCQLAPWCADWPIRAAGGWRGDRFKKD